MKITFAGIVLCEDSASEFVAGFEPGAARRVVQSEQLIGALAMLHIDRDTCIQDLPIVVEEFTSAVHVAWNRAVQRRAEIPGAGTLIVEHTFGGFLHRWTFRNAACAQITPDVNGPAITFTYAFQIGTVAYVTEDPEAEAGTTIDWGADWDDGAGDELDGGHFVDTYAAATDDAGTWD